MRSLACLALSILYAGSAIGEALPDLQLSSPELIVRDAEIVAERDGLRIYRKEVLSKVYHLDRIYKSMMGPISLHEFTLLDSEPELLWLLAYEASMTEPDGDTELGARWSSES